MADVMARIEELLGGEADDLLNYKAAGIPREMLHLPSPDFVDRQFAGSDRSPRVLSQLQRLYDTGNLAHSGYLSILPVDQGVEHSGGSAFAPNPEYFDPLNIVKLAIDGGANAVASTLGVLGLASRKHAHKIPFITKLNHNELLTYPNSYAQTMFATVEQAWNLGSAAVGATVYFGNEDARREITQVSEAFALAHELGMFTVLWCYLRNTAFRTDQADYHVAADLTGQANYLGVTIEADLIKQKLPECNGGYTALNFGRTSPKVYSELAPDHPIEWTRYQVANCYMGRIGLVNSGGPSGKDDFADVVRTAVVNKRAGGHGLITGRKAFQRPMADGIKLLNMVQEVYKCEDVTVA